MKPRASWPVLVLAGLSLVPILGFFFGVAAAIWGLLTDRPRGLLAAGLGAAGAILNIGILGAIGVTIASRQHKGGVSAMVAQGELDTLVNHIELYHEAHGNYPARLADLPRPTNLGKALPLIDHSIGLLNMTTEYTYIVLENGADFDLKGAGKDGIADTADDVYPTGWNDD